jgi:[ribosomal protein S5]-alanine N-acetyltransferase
MMNMSLTTPTLHTARLLLRPFTEGDTDAIYALMSNTHVLRYWDSPPWSERTRADRFIARCTEMEQQGSGVRLVIERAADSVRGRYPQQSIRARAGKTGLCTRRHAA